MTEKSILITGCSSGIGLDTAIALQKRGYRVFATARKAADVAKLKELGLTSLILDINNSASIQQALQEVLAQTGGTLYALFNNAGYLQAGAVEDISRDMMRAQFETNVFGPMELTRLVLPIMRKQGYGRIIQNCSILGTVTMAYCGVYNASKFALDGYSSSLRHELRGSNIHISIIMPGPITSKLRRNAFEQYQATLTPLNNSAYQLVYRQMEKTYFNPDGQDRHAAHSPSIVVKQVIHALESNSPKAHYYSGVIAKTLSFLKRILPDAWLDWVICLRRFKNEG